MSTESKEMDDLLLQAEQGGDSKTESKSESEKGTNAGAPPEKMPEVKLDTATVLGGIYSSVFPTMFPSWEVSTDEINIMAAAQGGAVDIWFPDGIPWLNGELINKLVLTAGAVMITTKIVGSRIKKPRKEKEAVDDKTEQQQRESKAGEWEM